MSTVFEELSQLQAKRLAAYDQIVEQIANGQTIAAEVVDQICRDADKSPTDLAAVVSKLTRRREQQKQVSRLPGIVAERAAIEKQIADANTKLDEAVASHQELCRPLQYRFSDLTQEMAQLEQVKNKLDAGIDF